MLLGVWVDMSRNLNNQPKLTTNFSKIDASKLHTDKDKSAWFGL
jgi:hypothetical protein